MEDIHPQCNPPCFSILRASLSLVDGRTFFLTPSSHVVRGVPLPLARSAHIDLSKWSRFINLLHHAASPYHLAADWSTLSLNLYYKLFQCPLISHLLPPHRNSFNRQIYYRAGVDGWNQRRIIEVDHELELLDGERRGMAIQQTGQACKMERSIWKMIDVPSLTNNM